MKQKGKVNNEQKFKRTLNVEVNVLFSDTVGPGQNVTFRYLPLDRIKPIIVTWVGVSVPETDRFPGL